MSKRTLLFPSLEAAARFSKTTNGRFLLNTSNRTISGELAEALIATAVEQYSAELLEGSVRAYTYEPVAFSEQDTVVSSTGS